MVDHAGAEGWRRRWFVRHWKMLVATALVAGAVIFYLRLPVVRGDGYPVQLILLAEVLRDHWVETGSYPQDAESLVAQLGPKIAELGYELRYMQGDVFRFVGRRHIAQVEYRPASDGLPQMRYRVRGEDFSPVVLFHPDQRVLPPQDNDEVSQ